MAWGRYYDEDGHRHSWFGLHRPFDPKYRLVTSGIFYPFTLFLLRFIIAAYCVAASIVDPILDIGERDFPAWRYYTLISRLSFIGLTAYFCSATFHTAFFTLSLRHLRKHETSRRPWHPLQKWGRFFQFLYLWLFATTVTYPIISTCLYWIVLQDEQTFSSRYFTWRSISFHALNSAFVVFEILASRARLYWGYLPFTVAVFGIYFGFAYLIHHIHDLYIYDFLDPSTGSRNVAAHIGGLIAAVVALYIIVWGVTKVRDWILPRGRGIIVMEEGETVIRY